MRQGIRKKIIKISQQRAKKKLMEQLIIEFMENRLKNYFVKKSANS